MSIQKNNQKSIYEDFLKCRQTLQEQLFMQTGAMFRYCYDKGISVPEDLYEKFDDILREWTDGIAKVSGNGQKSGKSDAEGQVSEEINETDKMALPGNLDGKLTEVVKIHKDLAKRVDPAKPKAILLIESEMLPVSSRLRFWLGFRYLGPIKIVRGMMGVSVFMLITFLVFALFEEVNINNLALGLYDLSGAPLAYNLVFLIAAAGIGASFAALFELRTYISNRTYDTVYATDYWIRFFLGLVSGLILAEMVPIQEMAESDSFFSNLAVPVLAMLGGFSVQAVYRILRRLVVTLETLVQGSPEQRETAQQAEIKEDAKKANLKQRTDFLSELAKIQNSINKGETPEKIKDEVNKVFEKISKFSEA